MNLAKKKALAPGSPEAIQHGCKCSAADNGGGAGSGKLDADGKPIFWKRIECPLHGGDVLEGA